MFVNVYQSKATADVTVGNFSLPTMVSIAREHWYLDSEVRMCGRRRGGAED